MFVFITNKELSMSKLIEWEDAKQIWNRLHTEEVHDVEFRDTRRSAFLVTLVQDGYTPKEIEDCLAIPRPQVTRMLGLPKEDWDMYWESYEDARRAQAKMR
jgi:hypothetical protein